MLPFIWKQIKRTVLSEKDILSPFNNNNNSNIDMTFIEADTSQNDHHDSIATDEGTTKKNKNQLAEKSAVVSIPYDSKTDSLFFFHKNVHLGSTMEPQVNDESWSKRRKSHNCNNDNDCRIIVVDNNNNNKQNAAQFMTKNILESTKEHSFTTEKEKKQEPPAKRRKYIAKRLGSAMTVRKVSFSFCLKKICINKNG